MKNKKILFISSMSHSSFSGGSQCSKRNLDSILEVFGETNVSIYPLSPFNISKVSVKKIWKAFLDTCYLRINGASQKAEKEIVDIILTENIPIVFIDSALNGRLVRIIKKQTSSMVITFSHNCEFSIVYQQLFLGSIWSIPRVYSYYNAEKLTMRYSDFTIGLNERDNNLVYKYYKKHFSAIIPVSLKDNINTDNYISESPSDTKRLLFVGSHFYPNIHGIKWFIKNVLPYINAKLVIVGKDIDTIGISPSNNIKIVSNAPSLDIFYKESDIVIVPIFKGSGMKVKTGEAMMHGKPIVGTTEAFQGYKKVDGMFEVNTSEEFINILNSSTIQQNYPSIRNNFLENYSFTATLKLFKQILNPFL